MNTLDSIIKLIDAGYTKSEIDTLINSPSVKTSAAAEDQPAPTPEPEPAPSAADPAPAPEPAKEETPTSTQDAILEYLKQMNANLIKANLNTEYARPAERKPEDILAEIIAPPNAKNKK
jgi:hypothetical protein